MEETPANATAKFLGPKDQWKDCQFIHYNLHGLWGGRNIYLKGDGLVYIREAKRGEGSFDETIYKYNVGPEEMEKVFQAVINHNMLEVKYEDRFGIPDEARVTMALRNAEGKEFKLSKWERDPHAEFSNIAGLLHQPEIMKNEEEPVYKGKEDDSYFPEEFQTRTKKFLGPEEQWEHCQMIYLDQEDPEKGYNVFIKGDGLVLVHVFEEGEPMLEKRYKLNEDNAKGIFEQMVGLNLAGIYKNNRPEEPGDVRVYIKLVNAAGEEDGLWLWKKDKHMDLSHLGFIVGYYNQQTKKAEPFYTGEKEKGFIPEEFRK